MNQQIHSQSEADTFKAGRDLALDLIKSKKPNCCVLILGDLGAGKTVFVKGMASALGIDEREIGSASFVIVAEYRQCKPVFRHIDLYRLDAMQAEDIGIWEYLTSPGIVAVEWAEHLLQMPEDAVVVKIKHLNESERLIDISKGA